MGHSEVRLSEVEEFVRRAVEQMEPAEPSTRGRGRPRVLPSTCLWVGLLVCVLRGFTSQLELWRLLSLKGLWDYPRFAISDQAVYNRLARAGVEPMQRLWGALSALTQARLERCHSEHPRAWERLTEVAGFAVEVVAIDASTLDQVARSLPALRDASVEQLLPGKLAGVFDVRRQQWRRVLHIEDWHQNEKVTARSLVEGLARGTLIVADLGYFAFEWFDELSEWGYWWVSRLRAGTSYEVIHTYYQRGDTLDCIVWLGRHRADRAAHAIRLVRFRVGQSVHSYITNVLDPQVLPMGELARVYARRWDFELAVKLVKRELGLHLLWSAKPVVVMQQVWAVLTISQVLLALRFEVALRAGVGDLFEVSMNLLVRYMPRFASRGLDPVEEFVEQGRQAGFIRPSRRIQPRAPSVPAEQMTPLPPQLVLARKPRYAHRRCGPAPATT